MKLIEPYLSIKSWSIEENGEPSICHSTSKNISLHIELIKMNFYILYYVI